MPLTPGSEPVKFQRLQNSPESPPTGCELVACPLSSIALFSDDSAAPASCHLSLPGLHPPHRIAMIPNRRQSLAGLSVGLLGLFLLPGVVAIPSSTQPYPEPVRHGVHCTEPQEPRLTVFSTIRDSLKESVRHWFHPSYTQEAKLDYYPEATKLPGPLYAQYGSQMVLRFNISSSDEAASLAEAADILFLDVWESSENWADIRIDEGVIPSLLGLLPPNMRHAHTPLMNGNELVRAIADTYPSPTRDTSLLYRSYRGFAPSNRIVHGPATDTFFDDYRSLPMITNWMKLLQSLYSTHVQLISVGKSSEGRDIWAFQVGVKPKNTEKSSGPRKTIIVSGGSHSREWISTSTVNYIANSFITQYGRDPDITTLLEEFDWILIPTLNPDGYSYSWANDRLWRKNRQPTALRSCRGLDLDRTYGFKWDGERTAGNPCSESFAGSEAFEAVESKTFSEWVLNQTKSDDVTFIGLIDLHSYSEQILYPYSFSCHEQPPNIEDLAELGQGLAKAIRTDGHENYKVIPACEGNVAMAGGVSSRTQNGGGSLLDWFYHEVGVKRAFQIKLRDKGSYGFLLPKNFIVPTGTEGLSAVEFYGKALAAFYLSENKAYSSLEQQVQRPLS